jgi:hypothetical protein
MGFVNLQTVTFRPMLSEPLPSQWDIRHYNRSKNMTPDRNRLVKYFADLARVCELEDTVVEWFIKECYMQVC